MVEVDLKKKRVPLDTRTPIPSLWKYNIHASEYYAPTYTTGQTFNNLYNIYNFGHNKINHVTSCCGSELKF